MKGIWIGLFVMLFLVVAIFAFKATLASRNQAKLVVVFQETISVIEDFHSDLRNGISPSLSTKADLQQELAKMKNISNETSGKIDQLATRIASFGQTQEANSVKEMTSTAGKYVASYAEMSNMEANRSNVSAAAKVMIEKMEKAKELLGVAGSPDQGDVSKVLDKADKLVQNFQRAGKTTAALPTGTRVVTVSYPTWVSTSEQRGAFDRVREIAQEIAQSRRYLGSRAGINWSMGKQGYWDYFEDPRIQQIFTSVRAEKLRQLREIEEIESVQGMDELSSIVKEMLYNSVYAFNAMIGNADYGNFKAWNSKNDILTDRLKRQYGISAR